MCCVALCVNPRYDPSNPSNPGSSSSVQLEEEVLQIMNLFLFEFPALFTAPSATLRSKIKHILHNLDRYHIKNNAYYPNSPDSPDNPDVKVRDRKVTNANNPILDTEGKPILNGPDRPERSLFDSTAL